MASSNEAKFARRLADVGAAAAVVIDEVGRVLEATAGAASILGRKPADLVGRDLDEIVAKGWNWVVRNALLRLASGSLDPFELLLRGRSGRRSLVRMVPQRMPEHAAAAQGQHYLLVWIEQRQEATREAESASEAQLRLRAYGLMKSHEAEIGRVAAELHDGVAPLVVMAKFMIEDAMARLARGLQSEATDLMANTVARLREVLAEVRRISTELRPSSLHDLGLLPTLEWHCRIVSQAYQALRVTADLGVDEAAIPESLKLDIFRIVQEALNNVVRHARASEAKVTLRALAGRLELRVEDNGVGFQVDSVLRAESPSGFGLHSIRRRVDATSGSLRLDSTPWQGTSIVATWQIDEGAGAAE